MWDSLHRNKKGVHVIWQRDVPHNYIYTSIVIKLKIRESRVENFRATCVLFPTRSFWYTVITQDEIAQGTENDQERQEYRRIRPKW